MLINARPQVKSRIVVDHAAAKTRCPWASEVYVRDDATKYSIDSVQTSITDNDLMMCNKDVMGYCLRDNRWGVFDIDSISDISFDSQAFDALMFPKEQKRQILSLVQVHEDDRLSFDDFVKGKGRGMVFLLYGDPGTGKTLTAGKPRHAEDVKDRFPEASLTPARKRFRLLQEATPPFRCQHTGYICQFCRGWAHGYFRTGREMASPRSS